MAKYDIKVIVEYNYEVDADSYEDAEAQGWKYEDYAHFGSVYSIDVSEDDSEWIMDEEDEDE